MAGKTSGLYRVLLPSGAIEVYCEMGINGGAYTFISSEALSRIKQEDIDTIFRDKSHVLLVLLKPNHSQAYTIIKQYIETGGLSVQLNGFVGYNRPLNYMISDYLYLGVLPRSYALQGQIEGFKSNGHAITFRNCNGQQNSYFAFYSAEVAQYTYVGCGSFDSSWRGTAKHKTSISKMPIKFFMLTAMHFGGCGCYVQSGSWPYRANPAKRAAIGLR